MRENRNVLIIGGTGVLSSAVTQELLANHFEVTIVTRGLHAGSIPEGVTFLQADFYDKQKIKTLLQDKSFIAGIDFICYSAQNLKYSFELLKDHVQQYVFISSCAVYDATVNEIHSENSKMVTDIWDYSIEKTECEQLLVQLAKEYCKTYTIIRPCLTYGNTRIPYGITPSYGYHGTIIQRILNDKPIIVWDDGNARSNMLRVEDFAIAVSGLIGNEHAYEQVFNICGDADKAPAWNDVLNTLEKILQHEIHRIYIPSPMLAAGMPWRKGEILGGRALTSVCSNEKIKRLIPSFTDSFTLYSGMKKTVDFYKQNDWLQGIDYAFDGDWDRIVNKSNSSAKCKFTDYLHNATFSDKVDYFLSYHNHHFALKVLKKAKSVLITRIIHKCRKIFQIKK